MLLNPQNKHIYEKTFFNLLSYFKRKYYERSSQASYKGYIIKYFYNSSLIIVQKGSILMRYEVLNESVIFKYIDDLTIIRFSIVEDSCIPVYIRVGYTLPGDFIEELYDIMNT